MAEPYSKEQYDYKCKIVCKKCFKPFHVYLNYSEFRNCVKQPGIAGRYTGKGTYSYSCPYCDFMRNTNKVEFVARRLQDDAINYSYLNYTTIDYAKIHKENKKRSLAK